MTDDQQLLASAYLDGDLDAAERARAEVDPDVMAEVELLRAVRQELRQVEPPDIARRDQAIAAALAAIDGRPTAPTAPVPLPARERRAWSRVLAAAAAVVAVVALGVVVAQVGPGDGDEAGNGAAGPPEQATLSAEADEATRAAPAAADAQPAATGRSEDTEAATEATQAAGSAGGADDGEATADTPHRAPAIGSPRDLVDLAERLEPTAASNVSPAGCPDPRRYLGPATYRGTPVEVFVDDATVTALDARTCAVVESVER